MRCDQFSILNNINKILYIHLRAHPGPNGVKVLPQNCPLANIFLGWLTIWFKLSVRALIHLLEVILILECTSKSWKKKKIIVTTPTQPQLNFHSSFPLDFNSTIVYRFTGLQTEYSFQNHVTTVKAKCRYPIPLESMTFL